MQSSDKSPGRNDSDATNEQANKLYQTGVMLVYGKRKSIDKAIKCIQKAITFNDSDYKYWQILGEAYYQRGSLNPAINCFMRSIKLAEDEQSDHIEDVERRFSDCTYSRLRMSDIRLSVGHLEEAAKGYTDIIASDQASVAALVGLARAELQMARNNFSSGLVLLGHSYCMEALQHSLKAIKLSPDLCLTWKLAADCCLIQFIYGQRDHFETRIDGQFLNEDDRDDIIVTRKTVIDLVPQFLCRALAIEPYDESACLWHNLGISLYLKSTVTHHSAASQELLKKAVKCLLKALSFDRLNSQIKNSLGVVAFHLNFLSTAQSYFIKSIRTNLSTSEMQFSNLGYIYTQKGEFRLASVAFNRCQAEEPLYARSWFGNALINEQQNIDNLTYLRHCHRLENNYESQLMYANKITTLPYVDEYQRDLASALDCMQRTINYYPTSLEACNTLGLLYERSKFKNQCKWYFDKALSLCKNDSRIIFNKLRQLKASTSCDIGDCCSSPEQIDLDLIKSADKLASGGNREYILNFIYYLFNNKDYKNVNSKMTKLLEKLPQDDVKNKIGAQILLGLAAKAERGDFKSWLFKNIIDSEGTSCVESLINLLCLLLIGTSSGEDKLVEQISNDLSKHLIGFITTRPMQFLKLINSNDGKWLRFIIVTSIFCLNDQSKLIRPLLALFPAVADLWLFLGLSLMLQKNKLQVSIECIRKAHLIGSTDTDLCFTCDILLAILALASRSTRQEKAKARTNHISRAIYKYPNHLLLWHLLKMPETEEIPQKDLLASDGNSALFQLAISNIIKSCFI